MGGVCSCAGLQHLAAGLGYQRYVGRAWERRTAPAVQGSATHVADVEHYGLRVGYIDALGPLRDQRASKKLIHSDSI